jgi:hypothetical protein
MSKSGCSRKFRTVQKLSAIRNASGATKKSSCQISNGSEKVSPKRLIRRATGSWRGRAALRL